MGDVNGSPPGKNNPYPKIPPPERQVDAVGGVGELARLAQTNTTAALAKSTEGTTLPSTKQKALEEAMMNLGTELHTQYVLSFVPDAPAPGYHPLEVRLAQPADRHLRARPGYWSSEETK